MGLQELQKSWDLENWVLDLFFRCLDESTAHSIRNADIVTPVSSSQEATSEVVREDSNAEHIDDSQNEGPTNRQAVPEDNSQPQRQPQPQEAWQQNQTTSPDPLTSNDWYGLFNFTDDYTDVLETSASQPDALTLQNLEFLYRFL